MSTAQTDVKTSIKIKRKGHPVGRLGSHVKKGILMTYSAFFRENRIADMSRVGAASIRP